MIENNFLEVSYSLLELGNSRQKKFTAGNFYHFYFLWQRAKFSGKMKANEQTLWWNKK